MSHPESAAGRKSPEASVANSSSLLAKLSHAFLELPSLLDKHLLKRRDIESRHRHWNVIRYFELVKDPRYQKWSNMRSLLEKDYLTFTDEAVIPKYKTGPYTFTPQGLPHAYLDKSAKYSQGFIDQQKANPNRAEVEGVKWQELERWLHHAQSNAVPLGETFIWFSPRGSVEEGYIGKEATNPNLISVYLKTPEGVEMTQFKTWSTLLQLRQTIKELGYPSYKKFGDDSHNCIANSGVCPKQFTLDEIETVIYRTEQGDPDQKGSKSKKWPITKDHLPVIDENEFNLFRKGVFEAYSEYLLSFLFKHVENGASTSAKDKQKTIYLLDTFFSIAIKTLEGWVYYNDQRTDKSKTYVTALTNSVKKDSSKESNLNERVTSETVESVLRVFFYQLEQMTFDPSLVTAESLAQLSAMSKILMLDVPMKLFSLGQCVGLAVPSMMASSMVHFKGGFLPNAIATSEGWLDRTGVCARGEYCISRMKGAVQNLGPCDWCFDCDGRFGYLRDLSNIDYRLFQPHLSPKGSSTGEINSSLSNTAELHFDKYVPKTTSISFTQFLAGDYETPQDLPFAA